MIRVRPEHWNAVLPEYRLGWEESSRQACLENLGPLSSVGRAMAAIGANPVGRRAAGGRTPLRSPLLLSRRRQVRAFRRRQAGDVQHPRFDRRAGQLSAPAAGSPTGRLLSEFGGATAALTFLEDGLHAVVTIQRK